MIRNRLLLITFTLAIIAIPLPSLAKTLTVGVFPRSGVEKTVTAYTPLIEYVARQSGFDIRLDVPPDMPSFWKRLSAGEYDIAHMNQYHYVRSHFEKGYVVILKNEEFGKDTIASALWVREDSPVRTLADLRGKWVVLGGGRQAMVASIMATDMLEQAGLESQDYFSRSTLHPLEALKSLYYRQADAAGVGDVADRMPGVKKLFGNDRLRMVARSEPVTHLPWGVSSRLDDSTVRAIKSAFLSLNDSMKGKRLLKAVNLTAIRPATDREYNEHREIILRVLDENYYVQKDSLQE